MKHLTAAIVMLLMVTGFGAPSMAQNAMPEGLIGKSREDAVKILEDNGINYQVLYRKTCDFHLTVVETDPAEGDPFLGDLRFATITVTNGSAERVPSIVTLQPSAAQALLERQQLAFRLRDYIPEPADWCSVWRPEGGYSSIFIQSPTAGSVVCPSSEITGTRREHGRYISQRSAGGMCP